MRLSCYLREWRAANPFNHKGQGKVGDNIEWAMYSEIRARWSIAKEDWENFPATDEVTDTPWHLIHSQRTRTSFRKHCHGVVQQQQSQGEFGSNQMPKIAFWRLCFIRGQAFGPTVNVSVIPTPDIDFFVPVKKKRHCFYEKRFDSFLRTAIDLVCLCFVKL